MGKKDLSDLKCSMPYQLCVGFNFQYCCTVSFLSWGEMEVMRFTDNLV